MIRKATNLVQQHNDLTILIPAAGLGRRMKSYGPKALIELNEGQTVLSRQLTLLREVHPAAEVVVVVGFEADRMCRHIPPGVRVVENEFYRESNVARSLHMGLRACNTDRLLIVYGDLVFNKRALHWHLDGSAVLADSRPIPERASEVGLSTQDGRLLHLSFGLPQRWGQCVYLEGKELALFRKFVAHKDRRGYFGFEILNEVLEHGGQFRVCEPTGLELAEIDTSKDIELARAIR